MLAAILILSAGYQAYVTIRVIRSSEYTKGQRIGQAFLIWLLPVLGAVEIFEVLEIDRYGMDARVARLLTAAEIVTLEELAYVPMQELLDVPGLTESEAQLFRKRAHAYLLKRVMRGHDDEGGVDA